MPLNCAQVPLIELIISLGINCFTLLWKIAKKTQTKTNKQNKKTIDVEYF